MSDLFVEPEQEKRTYSGDTRKVKHLQFPFSQVGPHPTNPDAQVLRSRVALRDQVVPISAMTKYDLDRGEALGSFYSDEELARESAGFDAGGGAESDEEFVVLGEAGEAELAEYIRSDNPTGKRLIIDETLALVNDDSVAPDQRVDFAKRLLAAESIATDGDPRDGVVNGLNAIIERENQ